MRTQHAKAMQSFYFDFLGPMFIADNQAAQTTAAYFNVPFSLSVDSELDVKVVFGLLYEITFSMELDRNSVRIRELGYDNQLDERIVFGVMAMVEYYIRVQQNKIVVSDDRQDAKNGYIRVLISAYAEVTWPLYEIYRLLGDRATLTIVEQPVKGSLQNVRVRFPDIASMPSAAMETKINGDMLMIGSDAHKLAIAVKAPEEKERVLYRFFGVYVEDGICDWLEKNAEEADDWYEHRNIMHLWHTKPISEMIEKIKGMGYLCFYKETFTVEISDHTGRRVLFFHEGTLFHEVALPE